MLEQGIREQTICDIKREKSKILSFTASPDSSYGLKKFKFMKKFTYEYLDRAMLQWLNQQSASGTPMTGAICVNKANVF